MVQANIVTQNYQGYNSIIKCVNPQIIGKNEMQMLWWALYSLKKILSIYIFFCCIHIFKDPDIKKKT